MRAENYGRKEERVSKLGPNRQSERNPRFLVVNSDISLVRKVITVNGNIQGTTDKSPRSISDPGEMNQEGERF